MKHLLITIVIIMMAHESFSQKIYFTEATNRWTAIGEDWDPGPIRYRRQYYYGTDVELGGKQYKELAGFGPVIYAIREDTMLRKVFCRAEHYSSNALADTVEEVLYDYNMQVGDSIVRFKQNHLLCSKVTAIDSILLNGCWHKVWKFMGHAIIPNEVPAGPYTVIEGIGCIGCMSSFTSSILFPLNPYPTFEHFENTTCFGNVNGHPMVSPSQEYPFSVMYTPKFDNLVSCTLNVSNEATNAQTISIYPIPATTSTRLQLATAIQTGSITLYNCFGQTVSQSSINNQITIPVGRYLSAPGQYFYRITDTDKNQFYTGKFIFE